MTINTKDRDGADLDIAAKDIAGVLHPRNILTDPDGADITPLTDAQLRAVAVPVSAASLPLPAGAATETSLAAVAAAVGAHDAVATDGRGGMVVLVRRRDSDAEPMVDDGDLTFLNIDE